jgi:hypothetical protein
VISLNAEIVSIAASDDNLKIVRNHGPADIHYGLETREGVFLKEGTLKEDEQIVLGQDRLFVGSFRSTYTVGPVTDDETEPDVTAPDRRTKISRTLEAEAQALHPEQPVADEVAGEKSNPLEEDPKADDEKPRAD